MRTNTGTHTPYNPTRIHSAFAQTRPRILPTGHASGGGHLHHNASVTCLDTHLVHFAEAVFAVGLDVAVRLAVHGLRTQGARHQEDVVLLCKLRELVALGYENTQSVRFQLTGYSSAPKLAAAKKKQCLLDIKGVGPSMHRGPLTYPKPRLASSPSLVSRFLVAVCLLNLPLCLKH